MPSSIQDSANGPWSASNIIGGNDIARPAVTKPTYSGSLEQFKHNDLTPVIGREFEDVQVRELLKGSDDVIRDLAITGKCIHRCNIHMLSHVSRH